jgi:hypothetical protein
MKNLLFLLFAIPFVIFSCSEEEKNKKLLGIEWGEKDVIIEVGEELQLSLFPQPSDAKLPGCSYFSGDEKIVTISESGIIKGIAGGTTVVNAKTNDGEYYAECKVTVNSNGLYREPYLVFGCSVADIKDYETREVWMEDSELLAYYGENSDVAFVLYLLDNEKMEAVGINFNETTDIEDRIIAFLGEKYEYIGIDEEEILYFISSDEKMLIVLMTEEDETLSVLYMPYLESESSFRSASDWKIRAKETCKAFNKLNHEIKQH